ncbi:Mor transcription activator family protein [Comamonas sp.]|uniref:Mor transcription activator family protein n=1 Tax=Comamonas sp. TaxID=34028 RepID=UPI0026495124|nr:Mor transcription activator family protein [Comamonas sp.]
MQTQAQQAQPAIKTMNDKDATSTPSVSGHNKLDPIAVLREELAAAALCHGVERVEDLTEELVRRYVQRLGGLNVYVRNERVRERERVAQEIRASFDGCNARELACRFGLSVRQVQRILLDENRTKIVVRVG